MKQASSLLMCLVLVACSEKVAPQKIESDKEQAMPAAALNLEFPKEEHEGERDAEPKPESIEEHGDVEGITLRRMSLTEEILNREPVTPTTQFEEVNKLYVFLDLRNDSDVDQNLVVSFVGPDGQRRGNVVLGVPANAPRWRTWAYTKHAQAPGTWIAEVTVDGETLASKSFEVL